MSGDGGVSATVGSSSVIKHQGAILSETSGGFNVICPGCTVVAASIQIHITYLYISGDVYD